MCGVKYGANGKRTIEIRFVGGPLRESANEHSARIAGIEIMGHFCRYGDDIGDARGTGNVNRSSRRIRQVNGGEKTRSTLGDIGHATPSLKNDFRITTPLQ